MSKRVYKYIEIKDLKDMLNKTMPQYKAIRGMTITEKELIKTTTNKIKRQANLDAMKKLNIKNNLYFEIMYN